MSAGWTATMRMLADAAKLINVPEDEVILREYVKKLEAFPADVLERAIKRVALTHEYKTPPKVGTFVKHISNDLNFQRTKAMMQNVQRLKAMRPLESRQKPDEAERQKVIAGFRDLLAAM
jgi:hypothetical protein